MSEMKLLMENWQTFLIEAEPAVKPQPIGITWGQLIKMIEGAIALKAAKTPSRRKKIAIGLGATFGKVGLDIILTLTGTSTLAAIVTGGKGAAEVIHGLIKAFAKAPDSETANNPLFHAFNVDDGFTELVKEELLDQFLDHLFKVAGTLPENAPINHINQMFQHWLTKQTLGGKKGNTVVNQTGKASQTLAIKGR